MLSRHRSLPPTASWAVLCLALPLMAGCAAGPDYKQPAAPNVAQIGAKMLPDGTATASVLLGGPQRFQKDGDIPAAWWRLFESASLNHLMEQAITYNPSLEAARASLRAAQETAAASNAAFWPSIEGGATASRSKNAGSAKPFSLYNTSVSASYAPDVFGGARRTQESSEALAELGKFELEAAYLTLTSNIATTAFREASLRGQIEATNKILDAQKKQLEIVKARFDAGAVAKSAVLTQTAAISSTQAALPALEKALAENRHLMSTLLGRFPSEEVGATFNLSSFKLPSDLPVSVPSKLVKQRPDIRAAEASLQAANAQIGVTMAAMLPQFPLTAAYGVGAARVADLFSPTTAVWGLGAGILQPIFEGGKLLHQKRAAEANFDKAAAQYRATVLAAFQDTANVLQAIESDAQALKAQAEAEKAAAESLALATQQFEVGAIGYADLLSAQNAHQQTKIALVQAQAQRLADTAALFQSLGGGWWQRETTDKK